MHQIALPCHLPTDTKINAIVARSNLVRITQPQGVWNPFQNDTHILESPMSIQKLWIEVVDAHEHIWRERHETVVGEDREYGEFGARH